MKKIFYIFLIIFFCQNAYAIRHYERDFVDYYGSGYVTVDVTDSIEFRITVTKNKGFFCDNPQHIVQAGKQYEITTYPSEETDIRIEWDNFDGCDYIYEGVTAIGTMQDFPESFNIWNSFRIYCGIWKYNDYIEIEPEEPPTTSSTSIITTTTSSILATTTTTPVPPPTTTTAKPMPCAMEEIYGKDSEEIILMRYLRDEFLSQTPEGQELINFYYQLSPAIMKAIEDPQFKQQLKEIIDQFLKT